MTDHLFGFFRGLLMLSPGIIGGIAIAALVPPRVIGFACVGVLLLIVHFTGMTLRWPWRRRP